MRTLILVALLLSAVSLSAEAQSISQSSATVVCDNVPGGHIAGNFYGADAGGASPSNTAVSAAGKLLALPFCVNKSETAKSLSFDIGTANTVSWNVHMGIYADNGSGRPGNLVANSDTGVIALTSSSTGVQTGTMNGSSGVVLTPGWYWLTWIADTTGASVYSVGPNAAGLRLTQTVLGTPAAVNAITAGTMTDGVSATQTFGALPNTFPTPSLSTGAAVPYMAVGY